MSASTSFDIERHRTLPILDRRATALLSDKPESKVKYLGLEVDDGIKIAQRRRHACWLHFAYQQTWSACLLGHRPRLTQRLLMRHRLPPEPQRQLFEHCVTDAMFAKAPKKERVVAPQNNGGNILLFLLITSMH